MSTVVLKFVVVSVILTTGWNKEEQEDDESDSSTDKVKVDQASWNCVPNIDQYYSENFRYVNTYAEYKCFWPNVYVINNVV
jgi:hypothetical protein